MRNRQSNLMDLKGMAIMFVSYNLKGHNMNGKNGGKKLGKFIQNCKYIRLICTIF